MMGNTAQVASERELGGGMFTKALNSPSEANSQQLSPTTVRDLRCAIRPRSLTALVVTPYPPPGASAELLSP